MLIWMANIEYFYQEVEKVDEQRINDASKKKGGKGWVIAGILVAIVIVILLGIIIYLLQSQKTSQQSESVAAVPQQRNVVVAPENVDEVIAQMEEEAKTPVGSYEVTMNTHWTFPNGKSASSDAFVENSTSNTNMVYFIISLDSSGEEIYRSPYLELGAQLRDITLDKELEKGDYDSIITYHLVDDDFNELSSVSMYMMISIEN